MYAISFFTLTSSSFVGLILYWMKSTYYVCSFLQIQWDKFYFLISIHFNFVLQIILCWFCYLPIFFDQLICQLIFARWHRSIGHTVLESPLNIFVRFMYYSEPIFQTVYDEIIISAARRNFECDTSKLLGFLAALHYVISLTAPQFVKVTYNTPQLLK
jgi:hypothetical protein